MTVPKLDNIGKDFVYWWEKEGSWFEEPNYRRGGFSGVLTAVNEQGDLFFIKRQESHVFRSLRYLFTAPTIVREYNAYVELHKNNINTPDLVYCGVQGKKATLVTKALIGYISLEHWLNTRESENYNQKLCLTIIGEVAKTLAHFHKKRLQHNCISVKHLFVRVDDLINPLKIDVVLLDFEKTRKRFLAKRAAIHDMIHVKKHTKPLLIDQEWKYFISTYEKAFGQVFPMLY